MEVECDITYHPGMPTATKLMGTTAPAKRGSRRQGAHSARADAAPNGSAAAPGVQIQQKAGSIGQVRAPADATSTSETNEEGMRPMELPEEASAADAPAPELPRHLMPSRVQLNRIQIGPRLRPAVHTQFSEYIHQLANVGVTQSDVVESALLEYMDRYPPEVLRAALLEGR
jgi:hypothetical protein